MIELLFMLGILLILVYLLLKLIGLRVIPNDKVGIVEKWWSFKGSLNEQIIALRGEAGFQPEVLRGGIHFRTPLMYKVHIVPLVTIPQGQIGYVFARDGKPLEPTQTLGKVIPECNNFQDVRAFLENGGQRGPQRAILREGTYAFNLAQFIVITEDKIYYLPMGNKEEKEMIEKMVQTLKSRNAFRPIVITEDKVGIVTVHDGPSLPSGDIVAPTVGDDPSNPETYHNNFQDPEKFLKAGGFRGRQLQVLVEGTYFINRLFATVELIDKTVIEVGYVGVVVSYVGPKGQDTSGEDYKHGELVERGFRGVWKDPLMPGKYAFNTYAGKIVKVPTTNIILKWISNQTGTHRYDENLKEVSLITKDAFEPSLPLAVVLHIDYRKAPLVVQRFGDLKMLVEQTLDPMVSAYFKNIGQRKTLIELIQQRDEIQKIASEEMKERFAHYNLELEEVLIGTPMSSPNDNKIDAILEQLRDRQIALEQIETYSRQQKAAEKERELREAEARAAQQKLLTESEINIQIQTNQGKAEYQRSIQEAQKIKALAEAEAEKEARIGIGRAIAIEEQVKAYGGPQYQVLQDVMGKFTQALEKTGIDIVPETVVAMGEKASSASFNAFEMLLTLLLTKELGVEFKGKETEDENVKKIKQEILNSILLAKESDKKEKTEEISQDSQQQNAVS
ncbi:band 7 protein [Caldicellulosiruptor obsidiansis OB47]|uniref:Band 7 protein n=1 Tax=Caldicellulosiruptor obsidiansis (strain ATCC BAA-2073 / JCM 16842 / OB47) TaxID=608506 RepID=D9THD5_CALOO|nr:SPFH domain-containing protein [Caldicellulosiruptor obsidiansis]ADL41500.1 band 7 protein [Caldicellulosiruptor obsidiansis OB47]